MIETKPIRGDIEIFEVPVNELGRKLPESKGMNMIMLGAFIKKSGLVSLETMFNVLKDSFGEKNPNILKLNKSAILIGYEYLK